MRMQAKVSGSVDQSVPLMASASGGLMSEPLGVYGASDRQSLNGTTYRHTLTAGIRAVKITANGGTLTVLLGDSSVVADADSHVILDGDYIVTRPGDATHISIFAPDGEADAHISEIGS